MIKKKKVYVIAEIGVNHNGSFKLARNMILKAKQCGADAVKFQTYKAEEVTLLNTRKAKYQMQNSTKEQTQFKMLKKYELSYDVFIKLKKYSKSINIDFFSTATDASSLKFLLNKLKIKTIKIASGDITNLSLLYDLGKSRKKIIISTGMSTFNDIDVALSSISHGYLQLKEKFNLKKHKNLYKKNLGYLKKNVTLMHCTTEYPAPLKELNLNAIDSIRQRYGLNVGYSDHSCNLIIPVIAVSQGVNMIEVHVTSNNNLSGPDHKSSLNYSNFKKYIDNIRAAEVSLGSNVKHITMSEKNNIKNVRKSLVFNKDLKCGQKITYDTLVSKRAGKGISSKYFFEFIGKTVNQNIEKNLLVAKKYIKR